MTLRFALLKATALGNFGSKCAWFGVRFNNRVLKESVPIPLVMSAPEFPSTYIYATAAQLHHSITCHFPFPKGWMGLLVGR